MTYEYFLEHILDVRIIGKNTLYFSKVDGAYFFRTNRTLTEDQLYRLKRKIFNKIKLTKKDKDKFEKKLIKVILANPSVYMYGKRLSSCHMIYKYKQMGKRTWYMPERFDVSLISRRIKVNQRNEVRKVNRIEKKKE